MQPDNRDTLNEENTNQFNKILKEVGYFASINSIVPSIDAASNFIDVVILANRSLPTSALITVYQSLITLPTCVVLSGNCTIVSKAYGQREELANLASDKIRHAFKAGLFFALGSSIPGFVLALSSKEILRSMHQPEDLLDDVQDYFYAYALGIPAIFIVNHQKQIALGLADISAVNLLTLFDNTTLSVLGYCLVNGKLGLPEMGVRGLGYAMTITNFLDLLLFSMYMKHGIRYQEYRFDLFNEYTETFNAFKELLQIGLPIGMQAEAELLIALGYSAMIGKIGADALSAYQIANQYVLLSAIPIFGLTQAAIILVARDSGAHRIERARKIANIAIGLGGGASLAFGILMAIFSKELMQPFIDIDKPENADIVKNGQSLFIINGVAQIFDAIRMITAGSLQSAFKDTKISMILSLLNYGFVGLTIAYLSGSKEDEVSGVCAGRLIGLMLAGSILFAYWAEKSKRWSTMHSYLSIEGVAQETNNDFDHLREENGSNASNQEDISTYSCPLLFRGLTRSRPTDDLENSTANAPRCVVM